MQVILKFLKYCWRGLNFIRDCVMNLVFLLFVLLLGAILSLSSYMDGEKVELVGEQGALLLNLDGYLADNRDSQPEWERALQELDNQHVPGKISTFDVVYAIEQAANDERIKGLVLDLNYFEGADIPALEYVGESLKNFKKTEKPVIAFSDNYTQAQYLLASYANEIYLNPRGSVFIQGLAAQNLYFKEMLDKLEVTPHVFRVGTYKSAVEPFLRNDMSPEARRNLQQWLNGMWTNYKDIIATNRKIDQNSVLPDAKTFLKELKALKGDSTAYVEQRKLVTQLASRSELDKKLIELFGSNKDDEPKLLTFNRYLKALPDRMLSEDSEHKIAVVNVEGVIVDGESYQDEVGGNTVSRLLSEANADKDVKAVVLRVNSPGGSAFASEVIRQEVDALQKAGKPVVVSMGSMAASGGYWISSTADYIVADKNTITGSIGIFALFPTFEKTVKKWGISSDGVATSELSDVSLLRPLSSELNDVFQMEIEYGYDEFLSVVSKGRKLSKEEVDKIAQGQVWLGQDAYKNKLVDELGNFDTALNKAIELANAKLADDQKTDDYSVEWFVEEDDSTLNKLMSGLRGSVKSLVKSTVDETIGLPKEAAQIKQSLGVLTKFNDPKGQYLYCLNCGRIK